MLTASLGIKHHAAGDGAHHGEVFQRHLRRAVLADADADVRADEFEVRHRNARHADLVESAGEERRERGRERHLAARAKTDGHGHEVLLRDETFRETIRELLEKLFRVGGILRVAVHRHDALIRFADPGERGAVSFARGDQITQLVAEGGIARGRGVGRGGQRMSARESPRRRPDLALGCNSAMARAASSLFNGLPCQPSLSCRKETPAPL